MVGSENKLIQRGLLAIFFAKFSSEKLRPSFRQDVDVEWPQGAENFQNEEDICLLTCMMSGSSKNADLGAASAPKIQTIHV